MNGFFYRMNFIKILSVCALSQQLIGCDGSSDSRTDTEIQPALEDWNRNIISTDIYLNLDQRKGTAIIRIDGSYTSNGISFEVGDLLIDMILVNGQEVNYKLFEDRLDVEVPKVGQELEVTVDYSFSYHEAFNGVSTDGYSFTWPYYCGNIFPCHSNPKQGSRYGLHIGGLPEGLQAVYPDSIQTDAPSYMVGFSVADYNYLGLGETDNGTEVGAYYRAEEYANVLRGTQYLRQVVNWYEQTLGDYLFGDKMASVSVAWSDSGYGGMEHHPYWHVNSKMISQLSVHAHEAAHGWFGNGVRIACWEEFFLSEGLASYLTARVIEEVVGEVEGDAVWSDYRINLDNLQNSNSNKIAWPDGCGELDIIEDELFGVAPYMKGAFFLKDLEMAIGKDVLDHALKLFYMDNMGESARFVDFLKIVESESGFDPTHCAYDWLKSETLPEQAGCR